MKSNGKINDRGHNTGTKEKISANNQLNQARQEPSPLTCNLRQSSCLDSCDIPRTSRNEDLYANAAIGSFGNNNHCITKLTDIGSSNTPRCITDEQAQEKILQIHSEKVHYQLKVTKNHVLL